MITVYMYGFFITIALQVWLFRSGEIGDYEPMDAVFATLATALIWPIFLIATIVIMIRSKNA